MAEGENFERDLTLALLANARLAKELNHRVKNNLQLMASLIKLQSTSTLDPGVKQALSTTQRRLRALTLANELLLDRRDAGEIELNSAMRFLSGNLLESTDPLSRNLSVATGGPRTMIASDLVLPLALISSEILANAERYRQPGAHGLRVYISWCVGEGGELSLSYRDNGGGKAEEIARKLGDSLGMVLIQKLAEQICAVISISDDESGAAITISLRQPSPRDEADSDHEMPS